MPQVDFSFSDTIAGYVKNFDREKDVFTLVTSDDREFEIKFTPTTFGELAHNLGEGYVDCTSQMRDMIVAGRFLFAYGIFYPENNAPFEVKHLIFLGRNEREFSFEKQDWWIKQIEQLAKFYIKAQFGNEEIDFKNYRTMLDLYGNKIESTRQETDTISRMVYGFASAYLLTGNDLFLEVAEKGTTYLREHFCSVDTTEDICYWYHAVDFSEKHNKKVLASNMPEIAGMRKNNVSTVRERKMLSSEFGDDYDAIPAYEQIYALAGPTQTYRITGDETIRKSIDKTLNLFEKYYRDHEKGGYFSHIDPITFDPKSESLGRNKGRKNWNSVGDHAPAYLINLLLATGEESHKQMLIDTADTITKYFHDFDNCAFVQEKFYEDWTHDYTWGWQQNRGVVGHNLKIAWNLMRMYNVNKDESYVAFAKKIAELMPKHGGDKQRGGWYDVVERKLNDGEKVHKYAWHDRKAWWQQEQGILAYLILHGMLKEPEYLKYARESSAFYNAFFLDHDSGGVYFNVLANGLPYLLGTERFKGSHSMSGYHSFELCYLAAVYTNLLIIKQPMDFYFKPKPNAFKDNILRVAPDLLPDGSIKIDAVFIEGKEYFDFDAENLTVKIPVTTEAVQIKVRLIPTQGLDHFNARVELKENTARLVAVGELDARALPHFRTELENIIQAQPEVFILDVKDLKYMSSMAARALIFAKQKLETEEDVIVFGANEQVKVLLDQDEFSESISFSD